MTYCKYPTDGNFFAICYCLVQLFKLTGHMAYNHSLTILFMIIHHNYRVKYVSIFHLKLYLFAVLTLEMYLLTALSRVLVMASIQLCNWKQHDNFLLIGLA
jgi:hypothetical protein